MFSSSLVLSRLSLLQCLLLFLHVSLHELSGDPGGG